MVPIIEERLDLDLKFLRFFRDDGFLVFFGDRGIVFDMLDILNSQREELKNVHVEMFWVAVTPVKGLSHSWIV